MCTLKDHPVSHYVTFWHRDVTILAWGHDVLAGGRDDFGRGDVTFGKGTLRFGRGDVTILTGA